jgi:hypothetical protein
MNASKEKVKAKIEACLDLMVAYSERTGPNWAKKEADKKRQATHVFNSQQGQLLMSYMKTVNK